ncbi:MAG: aminoglycoside 6-adenylyltransferase [Trueperaceae bacterium]|nr:aminoglycoside 6-adenylyltransferase [Trueperaceae bacterium]
MTADDMVTRLVAWGAARADVRALLVIGSRARTASPADRWSDLDVVLVTTDIAPYLDGGGWVDALGEPWLTYLERTATGARTERRALFDDALDVDFVVIPATEFTEIVAGDLPCEVADVLSRGYRILLDKDGVAGAIGSPARPPPVKPSQAQFTNVVHDFWYHAVWVTKKLLRGELWTALGGLTYMHHNAMLPMVTWHAKARHGWGFETWHGGRYLETWADAQTVEDLRGAFARYEPDDVERALLATMTLFARLAAETALELGYAYPQGAERSVTSWISGARDESSRPSRADPE